MTNPRRTAVCALLFFLGVIAAAGPAHANVIWPGAVGGLSLWLWSIPVGLLIEYLTLRATLIPDGRAAFRATVAMNAVSALAGLVLFPVFGQIAMDLAESWSGVAYGRVHEAATLVTYAPIAAVLSSFIEWFVLRWKFSVPETARGWWIVFAANVATAAIACLPALVTAVG